MATLAEIRAREKKKEPKENLFKKAAKKTLDIALTPGYWSAGIAKDVVGGPPGLDIIKAAKTGAKKKTTYSDVLEETGWKPTSKAGKVAKGVAGFGLDVLLDPTTYIGIGAATKAGKAAKGLEGATKAFKATSKGQKALKASKGLEYASTIGKQAELGQRALLSFMGKPIVKGTKTLSALGKTGTGLKASKFGKAVIDPLGGVFSNSYIPGTTVDIAGHKGTKAAKVEAMSERAWKKQLSADAATSMAKLEKKAMKQGVVKKEFQSVLDLVQRRKEYLGDNKNLKKLHGEAWDTVEDIAQRYAKLEPGTAKEVYPWIKTPTKEALETMPKGGSAANLGTKTSSDYFQGYKKIVDTGEIVNLKTGIVSKGGKQVRKLTAAEKKSADIIGIVEDITSSLPEKYKKKLDYFGGEVNMLDLKKSLTEVQDEILNDELTYLKNTMGHGADSPKRMRDLVEGSATEGEVIGSSGWISRNDPWYQEYYAQHKKKPSQNELKEIALKRLRDGDEIMGIPPNKEFFDTKRALSEIADVERSLPKGFIVKDATLDEVNTALGKELFSTDIPQTAFEMGRRMADKESGVKFVNKVKQFGSKTAPEGFVEIEGRGLEALKGLKFDPNIAGEIKSTYKIMTEGESISDVLKIYDSFQNTWKRWTLAVFPAYHSRNVVGNMWNNFLAGVKNPMRYEEASEIQNTMRKADKYLKAGTKMPDDLAKKYAKLKPVYDDMSRLGVINQGFFGADIDKHLDKAIKPFKTSDLVTPGERNVFVRGGMKVGGTLEDNARIAHYLDKTVKGYTPENAAKSVKKFLFDYGDLTDAEQAFFKRVMPFYTWTRKNIPLQLEQLIKKPGKFLTIPKAQKATGVDEEAVGRPMEVPMPIYKGDDGRVRYIDLMSWLPAADLMKIRESGQAITSMVTPLVKAPVEYSLNYNMYYGQPIEKYEGQLETFLGFPVRKKTAQAMRNIRLLNEIDRLTRTGRLTDPDKWERWLRAGTGVKIKVDDPDELKKWADIEKNKASGYIRYDIAKAKLAGDKPLQEKLEKKIAELGE